MRFVPAEPRAFAPLLKLATLNSLKIALKRCTTFISLFSNFEEFLGLKPSSPLPVSFRRKAYGGQLIVAINAKFSIFIDRGIKNEISYYLDFPLFSYLYKMVLIWGTLKTVRKVQKTLYIWKWHDNGHHMRYLRDFWITLHALFEL